MFYSNVNYKYTVLCVCLNTIFIQRIICTMTSICAAKSKTLSAPPSSIDDSSINFHISSFTLFLYLPGLSSVRASMYFCHFFSISSSLVFSLFFIVLRFAFGCKLEKRQKPTNICYHLCCAIFTYGYKIRATYMTYYYFSSSYFLRRFTYLQRKTFYLHFFLTPYHNVVFAIVVVIVVVVVFPSLMPLACIYQYNCFFFFVSLFVCSLSVYF